MTFRFLAICWLALAPLDGSGAGMENPVRLARDGWFRLADGELFVPLGGFHGNVIPVSMLTLSPEEYRRVEPHLWGAQKTAGLPHLDLYDASEQMLQRWFRLLAENGVTAIRLFPRARVSADVLDLCGKVNPDLQAVFRRAFAAARPYGIRFLLQILPEPPLTGYLNAEALERYVIPRYSQQELAELAPCQRRFLAERKCVRLGEWFTDPDVLACQKLYLGQALEWVAREPQIFALEIYNEQGWNAAHVNGKTVHSFSDREDIEIRWTAEMVKLIKQRLPEMPVCLSHAGFGVTGFDPLKWAKPAGVDFYSSHLYAGLVGDNANVDFATVTGATGLIVSAGLVNWPGEWGIFDSPVPADLKRFSHRDAIWLSLLTRQPGFLQWTYEFPEEYRRVSEIIRALPKRFSPASPELAVEIGAEYRDFHTDTRYPAFSIDKPFPAFEYNQQKQADENIQRIYRAYQRSLEIGVPIRFVMGQRDGISLERFAALDAARLPRPIQAVGGYQLAYVKDANSATWIAYLRKRAIQGFGRHFVGVPKEAPLRLQLDLPKGRYVARLMDLGANTMRRYEAGARSRIEVAKKTSTDYVLVITRRD